MIPKKIHYCWFGRNPLPADVEKYIETWRRFLPDYEIKQWNEDNFDVNSMPYTREAYAMGAMAFVTDVVRLHALHTEGGIYFDSDVEVLKSFDPYLADGVFTGMQGDMPVTAVIASEPGREWIGRWLTYYDKRHFVTPWGHPDRTPNTRTYVETVLPSVPESERPKVYPHEVFCAKDYATGRVDVKPETVAIHHFAASWRKRRSLWSRIRTIARGLAVRYGRG